MRDYSRAAYERRWKMWRDRGSLFSEYRMSYVLVRLRQRLMLGTT